MAVRLIVTDLDGTLLRADSTLSRASVAAAREAREAGVRFVVATGRPTRWLDALSPLEDIAPVIIACNGAWVREAGTVRSWTIPPPLVDEAAARVRTAAPGAAFALEYGDAWAFEPGYGRAPEHDAARIVAPLNGLPHDDVLKLLIWHPALGTEKLATAVAAAVGDSLTTTFSFLSEQGLVELSAPGVTKAATLSSLMRSWGITADEVVAFGDMPNDRDMLRLAGRAFVPANAHESLIAEFDAIGHHDEDAVARQIRDILGDAQKETP